MANTTSSICVVDNTTVAGTRHVAGMAEMAEGYRIGECFSLVRDAHNRFDPWAVEVRDGQDRRIGYVSCECNEFVGRLLDGGKSVDTSMGFTPLAGLPMGTRCGDIDAGILQYLMNKYGMDIDKMLNVLNKKSGVEGLSCVSSDFRDLENAAAEGNEKAELAQKKFAYEVRKYVGAYAAAMGGVDAVIFTAGVGENDKAIRAMVCQGLDFMGLKLDGTANDVRGKETVISAADSKVKALLIPTNEELMIAIDTAELAK